MTILRGSTSDVARLTVAVALAACLFACSNPSSDTSLPGTRPATRVVSLVPAATEILFAIGAGPRVVAVSSFDHYPPEVESLPRVGALLDPDIERIISLRPDLVVVFEGQAELRDKLRQAGIGTFSYPRPTVEDILKAMRALGLRVGFGPQAAKQADAIEARLEAIRRSAKGRPHPQTMLVIGRDPGTLRNIYVSGGFGFLNDLLTIAGGTNVFQNVARENLQVTTEAILAAQPDVLIEVVAARPWTAADIERERRVWDELSSLPAVRSHRVYLMVGDEFVIPGPRIVEAATLFAGALELSTTRAPSRHPQ